MDFKMIYDPEVFIHISAGFNVKIKSGASLSVRNTLIALSMTMPKERTSLEKLLKQQVQAMSGGKAVSSLLHPDRVFYQPFAFWLEHRHEAVMFVITFGLILRGQQRRIEQRRGDFVLAVINRYELEDAARKVYYTRHPVTLLPDPSSTLTE